MAVGKALMTRRHFAQGKVATDRRKLLNKSLLIFFGDALRITLKNPMQAFSFLRTIRWLVQSARLRSKWKRRGILVPPIIIFSITNKCNLECKGCYNQSFHQEGEGELSDEKLRSIIDEAHELGVSFFVISGGEPFMRPEILRITEDFPLMIFLIFTNGTLIDDEMIARIKRQRNVVPLLSLEGCEEATDARRGDGAYAHVMEVMGKLKTEGIFFGTSLTLTCANFSMMTEDEYIRNLAELGCRFFLFLEYTPAAEGTDDWVLTIEQREQVRDLMFAFRSKYPALFIAVPWDEDDIGGCLSAGRGFVHINAQGDLEPCPFAPFSDKNLKETSLRKALQSGFLARIREVPELSRETGGGCVLWKERQRVASLLDETIGAGGKDNAGESQGQSAKAAVVRR